MRPSGVAVTFDRGELWRPLVVVEKGGKRRVGQSVVDRLFSHVVEVGGCWWWTGQLTDDGYGRIKIKGGLYGAHRIAYMALVSEIPTGLELDHLCRIRHCVNPYHLEPVTQRVNTLRGDTFGRRQISQTHCKRGHELAGDNLRPRTDRHRECLPCKRERDRQRRERARLQRSAV